MFYLKMHSTHFYYKYIIWYTVDIYSDNEVTISDQQQAIF